MGYVFPAGAAKGQTTSRQCCVNVTLSEIVRLAFTGRKRRRLTWVKLWLTGAYTILKRSFYEEEITNG